MECNGKARCRCDTCKQARQEEHNARVELEKSFQQTAASRLALLKAKRKAAQRKKATQTGTIKD